MSIPFFTPYGIRELSLATLAFVAACLISVWMAVLVSPWFSILGTAAIVVYCWVLWFFRDPQRTCSDEEGLFISPADGKIADITPIGPDSELGTAGIKIGVFMDIFNVHVNRAPEEATVVSVDHRPGAFLDVRDPHASERNESTAITLECENGGRRVQFVVRQIAGLVARRIVTDLFEGQRVCRGQRIGMIKFGSRLELLLPEALAGEITVEIGQRVYAGQSVLARAIAETNTDERTVD